MLRSGGGHLWSDVSFHDSFSSRLSNWRWKWLRHGCLMVSEAREGHCEASTPSTRTLGPHLRPVHLAASDRQRRNNQESCRQLLDSHRTNQPTNQPSNQPKKKEKKENWHRSFFPSPTCQIFFWVNRSFNISSAFSVKEVCPSETICEAPWQKGNQRGSSANTQWWVLVRWMGWKT